MRRLATTLAGLAVAQLAGAADAPRPVDAADAALERLRKGDCQGVLEPLNRGLQAGEAKSFYVLGAMYLNGACVATDVPRGLQQLERAAKAGEEMAAEQLILIHGLGRGVAQDYTRAGVWAVALQDIYRARTAATRAPTDASPMVVEQIAGGGMLDPLWTKAFGQAATIQALATERVQASRRVSHHGGLANLFVVVTSAGPQGLPSLLFEEKVRDRTTVLGSAVARPAGAEILRDIREIFEGVLRDIPALDSPVEATLKREFTVIVK